MKNEHQQNRSKSCFCYDINVQFHQLRKECNRFGIFYSSASLLKNRRASDYEIIKYCEKNNFHVITHNKVNFKNYRGNMKLGIVYIGIMDPKFWISRFNAFLKTHPHHENLNFLTISIGNKCEILDRRTNKIQYF